MRIATYNVEWFNALFDRHDRLVADNQWSGRHDVTRARQAEALGIVFTALDADAVMVIEAPDGHSRRSSTAALENFAAACQLRTSRAVTGFANHTQQEITLLYDPALLTAAHDPRGDTEGGEGHVPRFDGVFRWDLDIDRAPEVIRFSKPPLELAVTPASGRPFRMIGVHLKSKAPHGATSSQQVMRISIENRRKQLAQCIWLRQRVEQHLDAGEPLIVLGDLNDGPGLDEYERLFGRSGVEVVMGIDQPEDRRLHDPHARAAVLHKVGAQPTSARFFVRQEGRYLNALLDYVMLSPDLLTADPRWRIWHPFDDPACYNTPELRDALLTASDHFPVSVDLTP